MKILLVDDDTDLLDVTAYALRREGFNVIVATDGAQAIRRWEQDRPDLVILDVTMPHFSGIEVCQRIRQAGTTPVILLTALNQEEHIVQGFQAGADDYVTKPFSTIELQARVRAQLRRARTAGASGDAVIRAGALAIDLAKRSVMRGEEVVHLTPIEWALLRVLATNAGRTMTHAQLFTQVWGRSHGDAQQYLRVHIASLRRKLENDVVRPTIIMTEPGVGYRFDLAR
jgi:two-component system KDP operon response regulator KdpE